MISSAGALSFASAPNYEVESSYTVTVRASDGPNNDDHDVTVTVTDVDETEKLKLSARRPFIAIDYTAAFEEGMGDAVQSPTWTWERSMSRSGAGTDITGATAATYRPVGADRDHYLRVTASYNDGHSADGHSAKTLQATSEFPTLPDSSTNKPPTFPSPLFTGGATGLSVDENATARTVVGVAPQATDFEDGTLSYSLAVAGFTTDPPFEINATLRQIRVTSGADLDHEHPVLDTYSVTVTAEDEFNATATATFDITIEDVNEPPVAVADPSVTTEEDMPVTFDVLGNDIDPDEGDTLTVMTITTQPRRGRVVADPGTQMLTYTPAKDDHDTYTFTYRATDGTLSSEPAQVTVTVNPVNDAPEFETETTTRTVSEGAQPGDDVGTKVAATDVDGDTLTYSLAGASDFVIDASGPTAGQIRVAPDVTLDRELTSSYEVTVTATDRLNESDSITVTINVSNVNDPPVAANDTATTDEDQSVKIDVLDNDTGSRYGARPTLRVSVLTQPLNGRARVESDRTITYTPNAELRWPRTPSPTGCPTALSPTTARSRSPSNPVNDAPVFPPSPTAARSVPEDAEADDDAGAPVTATDVDENDTLTYSLSGADASSFDIDSRQRPDHGRPLGVTFDIAATKRRIW